MAMTCKTVRSHPGRAPHSWQSFVSGLFSVSILPGVEGLERLPGSTSGVSRAWATVGATMVDALDEAVAADPSLPQTAMLPPAGRR